MKENIGDMEGKRLDERGRELFVSVQRNVMFDGDFGGI